jgi:DNA-binding MarR family transcriptional regulator
MCSNGYNHFMHAPSADKPPGSQRFDSPEQEAFLNLWRTYDRLRALEDDLFAKHDLTAQQYNALRLLRAAHPATIPTLTLAGRLVSRAPDITRLLDRLFERGLITRERESGDRRTVSIAITKPGVALLADLDSEVRECHRRQLGHLDKSEMAALTSLLKKARRPHESPDSSWG